MDDVIRVVLTILAILLGAANLLYDRILYDNRTEYVLWPDKAYVRELQEFMGITFPKDLEVTKVTSTIPFFDGDSEVSLKIYANRNEEGWNEILGGEWNPQRFTAEYGGRLQYSYHTTVLQRLFGIPGYLEMRGTAKTITVRARIVRDGFADDSKVYEALFWVGLFWAGILVLIWLPYGKAADRLFRRRTAETV